MKKEDLVGRRYKKDTFSKDDGSSELNFSSEPKKKKEKTRLVVAQGSHSNPRDVFCYYLALGLGVDGNDALEEMFDLELILVVTEYFQQAPSLVNAIGRY